MGHVSKAYGHMFDFKSRSSRSEYWFFTLFQVLVLMGAAVLMAAITEPGDQSPLVSILFGVLIPLALIVPSLALTIRRLHDQDRRGWWVLVGAIPLVGSLVLLVFMVLPGTPHANRFGPVVAGV